MHFPSRCATRQAWRAQHFRKCERSTLDQVDASAAKNPLNLLKIRNQAGRSSALNRYEFAGITGQIARRRGGNRSPGKSVPGKIRSQGAKQKKGRWPLRKKDSCCSETSHDKSPGVSDLPATELLYYFAACEGVPKYQELANGLVCTKLSSCCATCAWPVGLGCVPSPTN